MFGLIKAFALRQAPVVWGYVGMIGALVLLLLGARNAGRQAEQIANMKKTLEAVKVRDEIKNSIAAGDAGNIAELRGRWTRPD